MIRPAQFYFNAETAQNNYFQKQVDIQDANHKAIQEFDGMIELLKNNGIEVITIQDTLNPSTPDSIFPNNWISFHEDNSIILYPMCALNRRLERKDSVLNHLKSTLEINKIIDLTHYENQNLFLEGTGSMVLDRFHKICYANISIRMDESVLKDWCAKTQYLPITFTSFDSQNLPIYHTNVMMCVGDTFVVICLDAIHDIQEKTKVKQTILNNNQTIIEISLDQMNSFAGNMLQLFSKQGKSFLIMSNTAYTALNSSQIQTLEKFATIIHPHIPTIETLGGGSVRCMLAEVYNSKI